MSYVKIEQNEDFTFSIAFTEKFYEVFEKYYKGGSYFNILFRLFGMLPQDFYHYVDAVYGASFKPSKFLMNFIHMSFKVKDNAIRFADEIDRRIKYCVDRGDFY